MKTETKEQLRERIKSLEYELCITTEQVIETRRQNREGYIQAANKKANEVNAQALVSCENALRESEIINRYLAMRVTELTLACENN